MKLSIITINYNNKVGLEKTIASIMQQTWRDFEWILIDGGSTDGSAKVIEDLAKNIESNISYWCSEKDKGVYNAMNKGIAKAKGDYINFMNTGDCYVSDSVLQNVFKPDKITEDLLYGDWIDWKDGKPIKRWSAGDDANVIKILKQNICHQAIFLKTEIIKQIGYDENYRYLADWKLNLFLSINNYSFKHVPIAVCYYDLSGMSSSYDSLYYEEKERLQKELFPKYFLELLPFLLRHENILKNEEACLLGQIFVNHHVLSQLLLFLIKTVNHIKSIIR